MSADTTRMDSPVNDVKHVQDEEDENTWREFARFLYEHFEIAEKWEAIQKFLEVHPAISVFLIVTIGMCSVPVVIFSIFVISSVALTIMGFFFFEGTVIAVGTLVLIGVLFFVCMFAFGFSAFLVFGYYMLKWAGSILSGCMKQFSFLPIIGGSSGQDTQEKEE